MSTNFTSLQYLGRFRDHFQTIMVDTSTIAIMECELGGPDTVVAWHPYHWHGTSLQNYHPDTQVVSDFNQAGLLIFTPNRLSNLWKKFSEKELSLELFNVAHLSFI